MNEQSESKAIQPASDFRSIAQMNAQIEAIEEMRGAILKDGQHFGTIPGSGDRQVLFKAGAEKLAFRFRMAPRFKGEDNPRDLGNGHREYIITCELYSILTEAFLGAGVGSCSTMESKYRYRGQTFEETGEPVPNAYWDMKKKDFKAAQALLGGPGYAAKKIENSWLIVRQLGEKVENPDIADVYNTVLKQAKKRAMVDAVLTATAASDLFTQDLEETAEEKKPAANGAEAAKTTTKEEKSNGTTPTSGVPAGQKKIEATPAMKAIWTKAANMGAFQKRDDEGNPIKDARGWFTLDYDKLGKHFKEAGLPGAVKDMSPVQLATAMDLLKDYPA